MEIINRIDGFGFEFFESISNVFFDWFFKIITYSTNSGIIWIALAFVFLLKKKYRKIGAFIIVALVVSVVVNSFVLKLIFDRARPFIADTSIKLLVAAPSDSSFPSGHTATSFACATAVFLFHKRFGFLCLLYACLVGASRVYLHVHYLTDVIGGMIVGIVVCMICSVVYTRFENKLNDLLGLRNYGE